MQPETKIDFIDILRSRQYDPDFIPPPENTVFRIQGETIGNLQSFIVFSGLPKAGKSRFFMAALASSITGNSIFSMHIDPPKNRPKIALFDTESSQYDFYRNIDQLKKFAGVQRLPDNIDAFCTRQDGPKMQRKLISEYLKQSPETSVLVVDGLLDMVMNYNDERECRELIVWLKRITTERNILLMSVLHTGKDGTQRLGHLGANTDRWAQSTLSIEKETDENDNSKSKYILKSKFLRSSVGIQPVEIQYNKISDGWEMINGHQMESKNHWKFYSKIKHNEKMDQIFPDGIRMNYETAIKRIQDVEHRGQNYSKDYFKYLKESDWIIQDINGLWHDNRIIF
jgi:hypothetical protein